MFVKKNTLSILDKVFFIALVLIILALNRFFSFYASFFKIVKVYLKYLYAAEVPYLTRKKRNFSRRGKFEFTISGKVVK